MRIKTSIILLTFILFSCHNQNVKRVVEEITVNSIDLYPQYPGCDAYYDKNKQLECLQNKIGNFINYSIDKYYKKELLQLNDTLLINLTIDTIGKTNFEQLEYRDTLQNTQRIKQIFSAISHKIPLVKPAIYRGKPVIFRFTIPVIIQH